uniref:Phospho-2-dehydro-3-deoxyheptonate aldolase n=1 Tax=Kalanchoe fedtschenkoi TaxID=63787 RepID=A0A7N0UME1_KALFE
MALSSLIPAKLSFADTPWIGFGKRRSAASVSSPITAVHVPDLSKNAAGSVPKAAPSPSVTTSKSKSPFPPVDSGKWSVESWKEKKALQLPVYPDAAELEAVLKTLEAFPPIVFAGEARSLGRSW